MLLLLLLPARMKNNQSKTTLLEWQHKTSISPTFHTAQTSISQTLQDSLLSSQRWIWPQFELIQAFMHGLVTCNNKEDLIENEGTRVDAIFFFYVGIFPDTQGQLTLQSVVRSGPTSNTSEVLWLSLLPARK